MRSFLPAVAAAAARRIAGILVDDPSASASYERAAVEMEQLAGLNGHR